jgi:cysteine-rich repeat protein
LTLHHAIADYNSGAIFADATRQPESRQEKTLLLMRYSLAWAGICALAIPLPAEAAPRRAKLEARVESALRESIPADGIPIEVTLRDDDLPRAGASRRSLIRSRQGRSRGRLPQGKFQIRHEYGQISGYSGWARPEAIDALLADPEVEAVTLDGRVHATLAQGGALIGAATAHSFGVTGNGIRVAVLDTGIDSDHPNLSDDIAAQRCFCDNNPNPVLGCCPGGGQTSTSAEDDEGHGTSVAGIITSNRVGGVGVAPDAEIVAVKVLASNGGGTFSDVTAGLDWVLTNRVALGIRVVNLSIGDGAQYNNSNAFPCSGTNTANAINALYNAGVSVFVSSGNAGYDNGIEFPACVAKAIAVGGVYDATVGNVSWCGNASCTTTLCTDTNTAADKFVCHSSSDEILDLLAPDWRTETAALGGGTRAFGGTSAAAPYAAAEAALLLQGNPTLTPAQIDAAMKAHGPLVTNPENGLSFRRTDVFGALSATALHVCGNNAVEIGEQCDDGNTVSGDCCSSTCSFESAGASCSDANACTASDSCNATGQCLSGAPLACNDGLFCNGSESCNPAIGCVAGTPPATDDGIACTDDSCDEALDSVLHTPVDAACSDGLFCTGEETCSAAIGCVAGTPPATDDGIACTDDSCDEAADVVVHAADHAACDDGAFCTGVESCDTLVGCLAGIPPIVNDGISCTEDSCDEPSDAVFHTPNPLLCDDGDACTAEACDSLLGCSHTPVPGCGASVPAAPLAYLAALAGALAAAGALWVRRRFRARD